MNAVRQLQKVSGVDKVHAVVGGFHLVRPRSEAEARETAAAFAKLAPAYIIPMQCMGEVFIAEATRLMPGRVVRGDPLRVPGLNWPRNPLDARQS